jgi:hypothetical protein
VQCRGSVEGSRKQGEISLGEFASPPEQAHDDKEISIEKKRAPEFRHRDRIRHGGDDSYGKDADRKIGSPRYLLWRSPRCARYNFSRTSCTFFGGGIMPLNFAISEVRLSPDGAYTVVVRLGEGGVDAVFEVALFRRRERHSHKENLEHHKKSFEQLEREAKESVLQFSQRLAEALKVPPGAVRKARPCVSDLEKAASLLSG